MTDQLVCPKCGSQIIVHKVPFITPMQYEAYCSMVDLIMPPYRRKDATQPITQEELQAYYDSWKDSI